jgi:UDP-N-acetylglucosamine--N-acetylmuramyl-(pentapeptide) pyrophosphoryl-undecaprenol N-acetylglucosamine transferase
VCGRRDHAMLAGRALPEGYELIEYLPIERFGEAMAAADLVVARSGGSVFEIAAYGLPSVLIPFGAASGDHQRSNARWLADAGAAIVIPDVELTGARLGGELAALLAEPTRLRAMSAAARALAKPNAAGDVAAELLRAADA